MECYKHGDDCDGHDDLKECKSCGNGICRFIWYHCVTCHDYFCMAHPMWNASSGHRCNECQTEGWPD